MAENIMEQLKKGIAISDIECVVVRTSARHYLIKTGSEASLKPRVSSGEDKELRKGNIIYAQSRTKDIVKGYDLELTDVLMNLKLFAIADGGVATFDDTGAFQTYKSPELGTVVSRESVGIDIYSANRDTGGNPIDYIKLSLDGCEGKPCELTIKDGEFYSPKYTFVSTPPFGQSPLEIGSVSLDALPKDTTAVV